MIQTLLAQVETGLPKVTADANTFQTAFNITVSVVAAICLLIITIAGVQYIISQGDPQQTAKAKNTIIYAVIGLIVVVLAFSIVRFVVKGVG